ncbi:HTH domain-containing protein [Egbenema bharatensis]|uniref:HTH domain-containing protein n=1 Tax=Egbenema bharatensis TaxID=3463334 RepID=UPI003A89927D
MEKRTIAQAVIEVLQASQQPMSAADITQVILNQKLYEFSAKDPKGIVRGAIERRCDGVTRKDIISPTYFKKLPNGTYQLK